MQHPLFVHAVQNFQLKSLLTGCLLHMNYNPYWGKSCMTEALLGENNYYDKQYGLETATKKSWNYNKRHQMGWNFNKDKVEYRYNSKIPAGTWLPSQYKKWLVLKFWLETSQPPLRGFLGVIVIPNLDAAICLPRRETDHLLGLHQNMKPLCSRMSNGDARQLGWATHTNLE